MADRGQLSLTMVEAVVGVLLLFAATANRVSGGEYVGPGGLLDMRGHPEFQRSNDESYDRETARRLWSVSEDETGVEYGLSA